MRKRFDFGRQQKKLPDSIPAPSCSRRSPDVLCASKEGFAEEAIVADGGEEEESGEMKEGATEGGETSVNSTLFVLQAGLAGVAAITMAEVED